jgi:hypothetical protein
VIGVWEAGVRLSPGGVNHVDLAGFNANTSQVGDQAFANRVTYFQNGQDEIVQVNITGDATADFSVKLLDLHTLTASDFVL